MLYRHQAPGTRQRRPPWTLFRDGDDGEGNRLYDCTTVRLYDCTTRRRP